MRIGFDAKRAYTNTTGLGNYSRFVISALQTQFPQNQYYLFTTRQNNVFRNFVPASPHLHLVKPPGLYRVLPDAWRLAGINNSIKNLKLDIFHGLSNELPFFLNKSKVRKVVTIHDLIFLRFPELYKPHDRLIYRAKFKAACQTADKIIAVSQQTQQDLIQFYNIPAEKTEVIYQDCNPIFHQAIPAETLRAVKQKYYLPDKYLLCVGTLERRKNHLHLFKAWQKSGLTDTHDLVLIGKRLPYAAHLDTYIRENKLTAKVHFLPYIPFQELPAIYQLAQVFVYPSLFEGFGIPILEALNSGVPVVTSTGSCFTEAGGEAALYAAPDDVTQLAEHLTLICSDQTLRQQLIKTGHEHAQQFRAEHTIPQMHRLYENLIGK
ncbi:glycosyltransferase family 4 protein [Adhaeribacter radiodurans]|uniref:Glycosyltransferase family 4 protein n=1 Tax=Adhaeribacter radiodurans TaxID=2745197 RepID=A0A7L7L351_9BACT|nr:glycosyltransferase family 1 protein [Adhaeribacter radiodurans]QMU27227.1 glycosyltransferase family 4 protein [Adhaeribacter radiodurans]